LTRARRVRGFTLIEVLVALLIVAVGLTALMVAVNGTARTSGFLRDKTLAQWIALNRLAEVRLNLVKFGQNTDTGELDFGNRKWHYDTRYFDTSITSMKRVGSYIANWTLGTLGAPAAATPGASGQPLATPQSGGASIGPAPTPPPLPTAPPATP